MAEERNFVPLRCWHLNSISSTDVSIICAIADCQEKEDKCLEVRQISSFSVAPVQNFGSSLKFPQSSIPSQNLSKGRQIAFPLHWNSEILQVHIGVTMFNSRNILFKAYNKKKD